ncbi:MAG TPA: V-type ATP synthase subunit E family protein [Candidatus Nanoarchaeia archaeon]|nr:V-type ATP synthase subunit E family protein [Candidatus Nanoarchaeia archaeon]
MGLDSVKEEVIRNAKEQASLMLAEARKEAGNIVKEAEAKSEEMKAKSEADTRKQIDTIKRQELASSELESRKIVLDAKKQAIENVIAEARKRIESLDDRKREVYIKKLLEKSKKELEVAYIYCSKKDLKYVKETETIIMEMLGGIIAENREKTIRVNYSFETQLESVKETELQIISKLLFG